MKLAYITNIQIPAEDAQSIQVQAMCKVFFDYLKDDFLLISPRIDKNKSKKTDYNWKKILVFSSLPRACRYFMFIKLSFFSVIKFKPDIIYSRDIGVVFFYHLLGYRTVYEIHKPFETKIGDWLFRRLLKKIKIVAISQALKNFIIDNYKVFAGNILVAHDGVDLEKFNLNKSEEDYLKDFLNLDSTKKIIMYTGSLQVGKGVEIIINLAKHLSDYIFCIVGGENGNEKTADNIKFIRRQDNNKIPYFLKAADLLILSNTQKLRYYNYTSPLKLFEYMASGVPILASNLGSIREVLNEHNAYLFDPENIDEAVNKIKNIFTNYLEAKNKSIQAFEDVKKYTWNKRVEKILDFIK